MRDPHLLTRAEVGSSLAMSVLTHVCLSAETCPQPVVPLNGRMLGRSMRVGHDVHFVCDAGFRLVGSETRACRHDRTWSGTQPFCRSEVEWGWGATGSALPRGSSVTQAAGSHRSAPLAAGRAAQRLQQWALRLGSRVGQECAGVHELLLPRH